MLLEGGLAVIVILACCAGVGMGQFKRTKIAGGPAYRYEEVKKAGAQVAGRDAWRAKYQPTVVMKVNPKTGKPKPVGGWANHSLPQKVGAFIEGGANFLTSLGVPLKMAIGILGVLVASFAATTLDTATRLQRYVVQELSATVHVKPLTNKYAATAFALVIAALVAVFAGKIPGGGGLTLWPLFGAANQLLAGLAFVLIMLYLVRRKRPIWFAVAPTAVMLVLPAWAMLWKMFNPTPKAAGSARRTTCCSVSVWRLKA